MKAIACARDAREARLLASIAERGVEEPLEGVDTPTGRYLLNGFKRYRCAAKLGIECVPYVSLGQEEAAGILSLMRVSTEKALGLLEQAKFIVDLLTLHGLSVAEVAETLGRSKGWVSMRRSLLGEMSEEIETFPFTRQPKLNRKRIMSLYDSGEYLAKKRNIIWLGRTGCGKTGLATSFLLHALDQGYRGYFIRFADLVAELYASLADHSEEKVLRNYAAYDCLVIDLC